MFTNPDCTCTPFIPELCPVCQAEMPPKNSLETDLYDRIKALEAQNADLLAALKALQAGFADGSIRFTRTRQSDTDPYHPANILMCAAIAKAEGVTP